jgi:hypothetical protein
MVIWGIIAAVVLVFIVVAVLKGGVRMPGRLYESEKDDDRSA